MKKIKGLTKYIIIPLTICSLALFNGCKEDEVTPDPDIELIVGDWILVESAGITYDPAVDPEIYFWKFKSSGAWQTCFDYRDNPENNWCDDNTWKWESSSKEVFVIGGGLKFKVDVLNETSLEGINGYGDFNQVTKFKRSN
jgi:hypothetical protein